MAKKQYTVLVAEDNEQVRDNVVEALEKLGCKVTTTANGTEAKEICKTQAIDLLITGVTLPGLDGILLTREVSKHLPVIVYTTYVEDYEKKAMRYGARAVVGKSYAAGNSEELCEVVQNILK